MKSIVLAGLRIQENEAEWEQKLSEAAMLCKACGMEVKARVSQKGQKTHPRTLIGSGKVAELKQISAAEQAEGVVFINELSGIQLRNLIQELALSVIDRSALILEIFEQRARTRQARLQVEAARLAYQLPRLVLGQIHADQQQGGGVRNRGAGETRLERSRRTIEKQIRDLHAQLKQLQLQQSVQSRKRRRSGLKQVCLIGYSNAGKSSLMNALLTFRSISPTKQVDAADQLFATLDSATRRIKLAGRAEILLSDTVGFVRDLPDFLLDAFESTLQEIQEADLLLEVIDASDPQWEFQHEVVMQTLRRLQVLQLDRLLVFNKADRVEQWPRKDGILISCQTGQGLEELIQELLLRLDLTSLAKPEIGDEFLSELSYNEDERGE